MEQKQAIIQHPCFFTRMGLEQILNNLSVDIAFSVKSLADCHDNLRAFPSMHLAILNLQSQDPTAGSNLSNIIGRLRIYHPHCRVIVVAEAFCVHLLKGYFYKVSQVRAVIAHNVPLREFVMVISQVFSAQMTLHWKRSSLLSRKEQVVLGMLMQGQSNNDIAVNLHLSNKTISYYKQRIVNKLGFPISQPDLINEPERISSTYPSYSLDHAIVKLPFILKLLRGNPR
ncbi:LuxR C-terminal-related transcriptional regulator [Yersinia sp. 2466 StPb PI]|uniref:helix-turn-helix transcriptional regulator n=1 Tax=Yersinia TaxID=629 RepID=UPI00355C2388